MSFTTRTVRYSAGAENAGEIEAVEFLASTPGPGKSPADAVVARIAVGIGNTLCYFGHPTILDGRNLLHFPWHDLRAYRENRELGGNPFLYPWANRLDRDGFEFHGQRYDFPDTPERGGGGDGAQPATGSSDQAAGDPFWRDGNGLPLHGLLLKSDRWRTISAPPDASNASDSFDSFERDGDSVAHRAEQIFDESHPGYECFPFTHRIEVEHRLNFDPRRGLRLRVTTRVENRGEKILPLSFGYHPYFSYAGFARDQVRLDLPARFCLDTDDSLLPTGRLIPTENRWPSRRDFALAGHNFDHGFTGLERAGRQSTEGPPSRNASGAAPRAEFRMATPGHEVSVAFGAGYDVAVIYAPYDEQATQEFVCFEPMLAPTNALGSAGAKIANAGDDTGWPRLRSLAPGASFSAEFEILARPQ